jgi:hypothetical protein
MYNKKLITYKRVLTDHRSRNLEHQSCPLAAFYMSRVDSFQLLHKDPPRLGKTFVGL